jgi:hypothetical protein
MLHVLVATRAVLLKFQTTLRILAVLLGRVIALFALNALERNHEPICFLCGSHSLSFHFHRQGSRQLAFRRNQIVYLFQHLGNDAGADGAATFADGEA